MRDALEHRGPDDRGIEVWPEDRAGLGHRRLAIIDLSEAGRQPMSNEDGSLWVVYNGEIYNFQELRRELCKLGHTFRSRTDTEVLLHGFEQWGEGVVHHLRGMFAFALWDRKRKRFFLARDRLGIKPLHYYWDGKLFLFASEIKGINAHPEARDTVDESALFDYLTYAYIPCPKTGYKYIKKLQPGHLLFFDGHDPVVSQYWDVQFTEPVPEKTRSETVQVVREALGEAVRSHMVSDVPVGVFLSGGLDSSTVTALMAQEIPRPVRSFSVGFDVEGFSETHYARMVADRYQTAHVEETVSVDTVQPMLDRVVAMYDEPYADSSAIPTFLVCRAAREYVKVVLSGDGGDEVFAGYDRYPVWMARQWVNRIPAVLSKLVSAPFAAMLSPDRRTQRAMAFLHDGPVERYGRMVSMMSPEQKRRVVGDDWARKFKGYDSYWYFRQFWRPELDPITQAQYLDLKTYLHDDILTKVDRASMAVSLEVRPPLLDHSLVELLFSTPTRFRWPGGEQKTLLKQAAVEWLPKEILHRGKQGFGLPWHDWNASIHPWAIEYLEAGEARHAGILSDDIGAVATRWTGDKGKMWGLLVLERWLQDRLR